jgi:hypothetical protein
MTSLACFALSLAAFAALGLAMERHHTQVFGAGAFNATRQRALRIGGWALLAASAALCLSAFGVGMGLVAWCGLLTAAGIVVAWLLPYRARWLPWVAGASLPVALLGMVLPPG